MKLIAYAIILFLSINVHAVEPIAVDGQCVLKERTVQLFCQGETVDETVYDVWVRASEKVKTKAEPCSVQLLEATLKELKRWSIGKSTSVKEFAAKAKLTTKISETSDGVFPKSCSVFSDKKDGLKTIILNIVTVTPEGVFKKNDEGLLVIASSKDSKIDIQNHFYSNYNSGGYFHLLNVCDMNDDGRADIIIQETEAGQRDFFMLKNLGDAGYSKSQEERHPEDVVCSGC